ncbi:hypothetical protein J6590_024913 [Homalodisca vitripennis]|nr:hypothetical protein J6590_024913 [Homalodisca vitripennis]
MPIITGCENTISTSRKIHVWLGVMRGRVIGPSFIVGKLVGDVYLYTFQQQIIPIIRINSECEPLVWVVSRLFINPVCSTTTLKGRLHTQGAAILIYDDIYSTSNVNYFTEPKITGEDVIRDLVVTGEPLTYCSVLNTFLRKIITNTHSQQNELRIYFQRSTVNHHDNGTPMGHLPLTPLPIGYRPQQYKYAHPSDECPADVCRKNATVQRILLFIVIKPYTVHSHSTANHALRHFIGLSDTGLEKREL